jgi:exodeoxyribonuclease-1
MALAWPVGAHPTNKNEVVVWDLASDPEQLLQLTAPQIRERLFVSRAELAPGAARLPLRTLAVNKCPVVVGNLKVLSPEVAQRWGVDLDQAQRHARALAAHADHLTSLWAAVYERPERDGAPDVDEDLYGGFVGPEDRRVLERLRGLDGPALAAQRPAFADARLEELVFRYRARNFPGSLDPHDQDRWLEHRRRRLLGGQGGGPTLQAYQQTLATLGEDADERTQEILGALFDYATDIAPDRD